MFAEPTRYISRESVGFCGHVRAKEGTLSFEMLAVCCSVLGLGQGSESMRLFDAGVDAEHKSVDEATKLQLGTCKAINQTDLACAGSPACRFRQ